MAAAETFATGVDVWQRAQSLHLEEKYQEAEEIYDRILSQNIDHPGLLATLGTLSATVAHEISNPLAAILANAATLLEQTSSPDPVAEKYM